MITCRGHSLVARDQVRRAWLPMILFVASQLRATLILIACCKVLNAMFIIIINQMLALYSGCHIKIATRCGRWNSC